MRTTIKAVAVGLVATGLMGVLPTGSAAADPRGNTVAVVCGSTTYQITTPPGRGSFTPAFDTGSNTVLIPVAFGPFTGTITGPGGLALTFTEPASLKGSDKTASATLCSYSFTRTFVLTAQQASDEGFPAVAGSYTFQGSGSVYVTITGR